MRRLLLAVLVLLAVPGGRPAAADPRPGFGWPLPGVPAVVRGFQPPAGPWGAGHRGVDLRGDAGAPVRAAGAGLVSYAGMLAGRGVVTVRHAGGLRTTYEPVTAAVQVGQQVSRGALLGHLAAGHPSCRAGPVCLHWGLLRGDTYLDPLGLLLHQRVRLLPLGDGAPAAAVAAAQATSLSNAPPDPRSGPGRGVAGLAMAGSVAAAAGLLGGGRSRGG